MNSHVLTIQLWQNCGAQTQTIHPMDDKPCSTYTPVLFLLSCIILKHDLCFNHDSGCFVENWLVGQEETQGDQLRLLPVT